MSDDWGDCKDCEYGPSKTCHYMLSCDPMGGTNLFKGKISMSVKKAEGEARSFSTGATRQNAKGKGTPVLTCPYADEELSKHFEDGAAVHGARNWEKGLPVSEYINSLQRHINAFKKGLTDERHDRAILWNAHCLVSTLAKLKLGLLPAELGDMPKYERATVQTAHGPVEFVDDRKPVPVNEAIRTDGLTDHDLRAAYSQLCAESLGLPTHMGCAMKPYPAPPVPEPPKVYVSHTIRGKNGLKATGAEMAANCKAAKETMVRMRKACPGINFYIPAEHEDFVHITYQEKMLTEAQILEVDCKIIDGCDAVLFLNPDNFFSRGMIVEMSHAIANKALSLLFTHTSAGREHGGREAPERYLNLLAEGKPLL